MTDFASFAADMVSLMKRNNCYKATEHTRTLMEIFGGNACSDECVLRLLLARRPLLIQIAQVPHRSHCLKFAHRLHLRGCVLSLLISLHPLTISGAGTYDIHGLILGRAITGIQAFQ